MNATMKNIVNGMSIRIPSELFADIQRIHNAIPNYWEDKTDYEYNMVYNKTVINGKRKPENYIELVKETICALKHTSIDSSILEAYEKSCFWNNGGITEMFFYPSCKEVYARYLCMM